MQPVGPTQWTSVWATSQPLISQSCQPEPRARAKGPSQRNRERDRPTSNLHPFNQHHHGVRFRSQPLLKSSARGPRHSPRHRVRAYQPSNQLPAQPAATNLQQQQQRHPSNIKSYDKISKVFAVFIKTSNFESFLTISY